jgi:hypothetical protein
MKLNLNKSIKAIEKYLYDADKFFYEDIYSQSYYEYPLEVAEYYIDKAFIELLILIDDLKLEKTYAEFKELYEKAKKHKNGLTKSAVGEAEPYLVWPGEVRKYLNAIANITNTDIESENVSLELIEIIRHSVYSILNDKIFLAPPCDERELHNRIEAILRCVFPDMLHEPTLAKQIKNFRPDTGIPSLKTLIEYKYISNIADSKLIADQILADTRGYKSRDWKKILFVIYETKRIKHEKEWQQFLRECETTNSIEVIVLLGEQKPKPKQKKKTKKTT